MLSRVVLLFTVLVSNAFGEREWCDLPCKDVKNTMCEYDELTSSQECGKIDNSMTQETQDALLERHNAYRNELAGGNVGWPSAANMRRMEYDNDLAKVAQRWASQCKFEHDKCRRTPEFESVGQNLLKFGSTADPGNSADRFHLWTDEIKSASTDMIDNYQFSEDNGHFTQVIWASSYKVGCGEITYNADGYNWRLLACNYGPTGNFIGQPIYKKGDPCSQCPNGCDSKYPNLCA